MKRLNLTLNQARQLRLTGSLTLNTVVNDPCKVQIAEPLILESDEVEEVRGGGVRVVAIYARQPARTTLDPEELEETRIPISKTSGIRVATWLASKDYADKTVPLRSSQVPQALLTLSGELTPGPGGAVLTLTSERSDDDNDMGLEIMPELNAAKNALSAALWRLKRSSGHTGGGAGGLIDQIQTQINALRSTLR